MKSRRKNPAHPRRAPKIDIDQLLARAPSLQKFHGLWASQGYHFQAGRLFRCKDRTFTGRFVWRHPDAEVSAVTLTLRGIELE